MNPDNALVFRREESFATITLNRPRYRNAVNLGMLERLGDILDDVDATPPRALILAASEPGFCAGVDIKDSREASPDFVRQRSSTMQAVIRRLRSLPLPVIAAVNGVAVGLGCELAISADLRIASPESRFAYLEPRVAVPSPAHHLVRVVGLARAQDMLLTARWLDADEALSIGLVQRLDADPLAHARDLARELAKLSPISLSKTKENLWLSIRAGLDEVIDHHIEHVAAASGTRDRAEALAAFAEKREPRFTGE